MADLDRFYFNCLVGKFKKKRNMPDDGSFCFLVTNKFRICRSGKQKNSFLTVLSALCTCFSDAEAEVKADQGRSYMCTVYAKTHMRTHLKRTYGMLLPQL